MSDLKVGRPMTATAGGLLAIVSAVVIISATALGLMMMRAEGYELSAAEIEEFVYHYIWLGCMLAGGILILRRRYILGGALALGFGIPLTITLGLEGLWFIPVWGIVGGILSFRSREKIPKRVLEIARLYGRIGLKDLAAATGKTEADVELSIIKLQSEGQPIRFDAERREVTYG